MRMGRVWYPQSLMFSAHSPFARLGLARQGQWFGRGLTLGLLLVVVVPLSGCVRSSSPAASSSSPTPVESAPAEADKPAGLPDRDPALACRLVRQEGAVLLDVRTPREFAEEHIEGAINIPYDEIDARTAEINGLQGGDKAVPIVVYCRTGRRAAIAKQTLMDGGRSQVTNLRGLSDWPDCPAN